MARKIQVLLTCDFDDDDTPAVETVTFTHHGTTYAFEACQAHLDQFNTDLETYVTRARRETGGRGRRSSGPAASALRASANPERAGRGDLAAVRAWARAEGHQVSDRGRIPSEIRQAYDAAHPSR
jgi:Lsr2